MHVVIARVHKVQFVDFIPGYTVGRGSLSLPIMHASTDKF